MTLSSPPSAAATPGRSPADSRGRTWRISLAVASVVAAGAAGWFMYTTDPHQVFRDSLAAVAIHDHDTVLKGIETLENHPEFDSHVALLRGAYQLRRGRPGGAMRSFEMVEPTGELRKPALELTGECLFLLEQLPLAAAQFQELLKDNPNSAYHREPVVAACIQMACDGQTIQGHNGIPATRSCGELEDLVLVLSGALEEALGVNMMAADCTEPDFNVRVIAIGDFVGGEPCDQLGCALDAQGGVVSVDNRRN